MQRERRPSSWWLAKDAGRHIRLTASICYMGTGFSPGRERHTALKRISLMKEGANYVTRAAKKKLGIVLSQTHALFPRLNIFNLRASKVLAAIHGSNIKLFDMPRRPLAPLLKVSIDSSSLGTGGLTS